MAIKWSGAWRSRGWRPLVARSPRPGQHRRLHAARAGASWERGVDGPGPEVSALGGEKGGGGSVEVAAPGPPGLEMVRDGNGHRPAGYCVPTPVSAKIKYAR